MDPVTIASLGIGLLQAGRGIAQTAKAKKLAASNPRPVYNIQQPILDNQALAEAQAGQGLDDVSRQVYSTGAERGLSGSIAAILQGGGSVNNIGDLYDNYQGGISKLALVDAQARVNNVRQLITQNTAYAGELDKQFQVNDYGPYADRAQAAATLQTQGNNNIWKGINTGFNAFAASQQANTYQQPTNNVYGQPPAPEQQQLPYLANNLPPLPVTNPYAPPQYVPQSLADRIRSMQGYGMMGPQQTY